MVEVKTTKPVKGEKFSNEMKLVFLGIIIIAVVAVWILSQPASEPTNGENGGNEVPTNPLVAILAKADDITSISYRSEGKIFKVKGDKVWFKHDSASHVAYNIYNPELSETVYFSINPNNGIVNEYLASDIPNYLDSPVDLAKQVDAETTQIIEESTIDGKEAVKVEVSSGYYWIWKDYGIVIQKEAPGVDPIQYTEIDFTELPDSIFEVPGH